VVAGQAGTGFVVALAAWAITGKQNVGWSAGYGAGVVIPPALFAGLTGVFSLNAVTRLSAWWGDGQIASSIALLAPRLVPETGRHCWWALLT
jgi:ATP synthase protein I